MDYVAAPQLGKRLLVGCMPREQGCKGPYCCMEQNSGVVRGVRGRRCESYDLSLHTRQRERGTQTGFPTIFPAAGGEDFTRLYQNISIQVNPPRTVECYFVQSVVGGVGLGVLRHGGFCDVRSCCICSLR
ncbi:unnamed protein product [Ectocarpus sp. 12 AP-2014]